MSEMEKPVAIRFWQNEATAELRLFHHLKQTLPEATPEELAELLQLEIEQLEPAKPTKLEFTSGFAQAFGTPISTEVGQQSVEYPPQKKELPFLHLNSIAWKKEADSDSIFPAWYDATDVFDQKVMSEMMDQVPPEPLLSWEQFWPVLHRLFGDKKRTQKLDINKVIQHSIKQQPMRKIPWEQKTRWPDEIVLIVDFSRHLSPFFDDFLKLSSQMLSWFRQRLNLYICINSERQQYSVNNRIVNEFPGCQQNAEILYLGDLGFLDQQGLSTVAWQQLGEKLSHQNARIEAVLPVTPSDWNGQLKQYFNLNLLDNNRLEINPSVLRDKSQCGKTSVEQTETLLAYLSPAIEITSAMVRKARLKLGLNISVESLIRQHPALSGNATIFQWQSTQMQQKYRRQLSGEASQLDEIWALISEFEATLPPELQIEQRQKMGKEFSNEQTQFIHQLIKSQSTKSLTEENEQSLLDWIERLARRATDERWAEDMHALYGVYFNAQENKETCVIPKGVDLSKLPAFITGNPKSVEVRILQKQNRLSFLEGSNKTGDGLELAKCELTGQEEVKLETRAGISKQAVMINSLIEMPDQLNAVVINAKNQELVIKAEPCPSWATGIGRDRFGLYTEVTVKDIPFIMRWIPPGEFMMGSPKNEPERLGSEGPQHRVRIEQGYWLAETACAQALWQAVMKGNPSAFKASPQNPVENITWKMTQEFIKKLNQINSEFNCRLPSEAEWEYACRAGTESPFSFGSELSTDKANYDGNYPYNNGKKGEYRNKTMPVKSFKANLWGLYQMHGNVWEWCEDGWHDNYEGNDRPDDGSVWKTGTSKSHVCRGGSWFSDGGNLRSAYRSHVFFAYGNFGFRLARGPELQSSQGADAAMGQQARGTSDAASLQRQRKK